jgi:hypothetical protein
MPETTTEDGIHSPMPAWPTSRLGHRQIIHLTEIDSEPNRHADIDTMCRSDGGCQ